MFYLGGHDLALIRPRFYHSADGSIIPFSAATRENNLDRISGSDQCRDLRSRFTDFLGYLSTEAMNARRVAVKFR
jgi:hypothetical protein